MGGKRAGAGRPAKGRHTGLKGKPFSVRLTPELRAQLDAAAARNGNGTTQELLDRLEWTFEEDVKIDRDPAAQSLSGLLGYAIGNAAAIGRRDWRNDPYTWRVIAEAFTQIMILLAPPGKVVPPDSVFEGLTNPDPTVAGVTLGKFLMLSMQRGDEFLGKPASPKGLTFQWTLGAAKRNLALKKEENGQ
jgi:hypothetical protein